MDSVWNALLYTTLTLICPDRSNKTTKRKVKIGVLPTWRGGGEAETGGEDRRREQRREGRCAVDRGVDIASWGELSYHRLPRRLP